MEKEYRICNRCVMDTTDPEIVFDSKGICNHCKEAERVLNIMNERKKNNPNKLQEIIDIIKEKGKDKRYDCIIGVSGGVDSSYVAYLVKRLGLRPLAIHLDNGWDSELAVQNIKVLLEKLKIDLYTYVINWEEFKDLQLAFLKASTPDSEIPTDHAIQAILFKIAHKYNIKYIINGCNTTSESILPRTWSNGGGDWKYIKSIHKLYGKKKLRTFPKLKFFDKIYFTKINVIENISILDYIDYNKIEVKKMLINEFNWKDYGGKHYESFYTKFFQAYILPEKFGYDKRKMHLSSLIIAGQIIRDEALKELENKLYDEKILNEDIDYLLYKFNIIKSEFDEMMSNQCKSFWDYDSYENDNFIKYIKNLINLF